MGLIGVQLPRLESVPAYYDTRAPDAFALSENAGLVLDPWEKHCMTGSLGIDQLGIWTSFEVKILVSRQNGKGSILECRELAGLFLFSTDRLLIHTAHEHKTASEHFIRVWGLIDQTPELSRRVARHSSAFGREFIETKPEPTIILGPGGRQIRRREAHRLLFIARTSNSGRGFTADFVSYDEDMKLDSGMVGASLPSLGARPNPQVWYTGSAGFVYSTQLAAVRRRGIAAIEAGRPEPGLSFYEYSADIHNEYCSPTCDKHDDPDSDLTVARANPGLGIRRQLTQIHREKNAMDAREYAREILGVGDYPAPLDGWLVIPKRWFEVTRDQADDPPRVACPVFSIDVALDRSSGAIAVAGKRPDGLVGVQVAEHHEGTGWIVASAKRIDDQWGPAVWVIDRRTAAGSVISELESAGIRVEKLQATDVVHASGQLYDAFRDDTLRHYDQANVRTALAAADWRNLSESRALNRIAAVDQSPLMAFAFAHWGYLRFGMEADYDVAESMHFDLAEIKRYWRAGIYGPDDIRRLYDEGILSDSDLEALADAGISVLCAWQLAQDSPGVCRGVCRHGTGFFRGSACLSSCWNHGWRRAADSSGG